MRFQHEAERRISRCTAGRKPGDRWRLLDEIKNKSPKIELKLAKKPRSRHRTWAVAWIAGCDAYVNVFEFEYVHQSRSQVSPSPRRNREVPPVDKLGCINWSIGQVWSILAGA